MTEILDQTDLTERAARLVAAAKRAGADAADAVCVRGMSLSVEVRLGKVEETRRAEGDDFTLRAFVGKRSATVSANVFADPAELAEARGRHGQGRAGGSLCRPRRPGPAGRRLSRPRPPRRDDPLGRAN